MTWNEILKLGGNWLYFTGLSQKRRYFRLSNDGPSRSFSYLDLYCYSFLLFPRLQSSAFRWCSLPFFLGSWSFSAVSSKGGFLLSHLLLSSYFTVFPPSPPSFFLSLSLDIYLSVFGPFPKPHWATRGVWNVQNWTLRAMWPWGDCVQLLLTSDERMSHVVSFFWIWIWKDIWLTWLKRWCKRRSYNKWWKGREMWGGGYYHSFWKWCIFIYNSPL